MQRRCGGVPVHGAEALDTAELASVNLPPGFLVRRVVAALEADLHARSGGGDGGNDAVARLQVVRQGLFHELRFSRFYGSMYDILMAPSGRAYYERLNAGVRNGLADGCRAGAEPLV